MRGKLKRLYKIIRSKKERFLRAEIGDQDLSFFAVFRCRNVKFLCTKKSRKNLHKNIIINQNMQCLLYRFYTHQTAFRALVFSSFRC